MKINLLNLIQQLETEKPSKILFSKKENYNFIVEKSVEDKKLFLMVCKNFLLDSAENTTKTINTIRYWFLHNLFLLMESDKIEVDTNIREMRILQNYFDVVYFNKPKGEEILYLPSMKMFSNWINMDNKTKRKLHHSILRELLLLDDNYFFAINYLKAHNLKFLENVFKSDIEKGNNLMMILIRGAIGKKDELTNRNFQKIFMFIVENIYGGDLEKELLKKNERGSRPINYLCFLNPTIFNFILERLMVNKSLKYFMERLFWKIARNMSRMYQLEGIITNLMKLETYEDTTFLEKLQSYKKIFQKLYYKILENKSIPYKDKLDILSNLRDYNMIKISFEDREKIGRKMWEILSSFEV